LAFGVFFILTKNYMNPAKKLLPFAEWTIIILGLGIRIKGCQSKTKGAEKWF